MYCVYKISINANIQVVNREKDPLHQICMQEPHCQVPSIAGHGLSYWLWYHSLLVGQRECISSEHFSEEFLSRTWAEYLVVLLNSVLWGYIKGNLLRFKGLFHLGFPWLGVTCTLPFTPPSRLTLHNKDTPQLTLASGVKRSGWQAANEQ